MLETDIPLAITVMKDALLRKLGDEVDLIFQYGSHLKGAAHRYSDVDLSYAPVHETTGDSITVMVGETLIDLYPMHWSHLEYMAEFNDISSIVLLESRILYQRTEASAERFRALSTHLRALLLPEAQPQMIRKAQEIFQHTSYPYYLLRQQAAGNHWLGCVQQAQSILRTTLHCLAVYNQAPIDTRKMAQVLALPELPVGFAGTVERIAGSLDPDELLSACEMLLQTTRDFLLSAQRRVLRPATTFPAVFSSGFPELMGDLQHVMLACERRDMSSLKTSLVSLSQELSLGINRVLTGVEYSNFNALSEYEQDLAAFGFPPLLPYLETGDFEQLHQQCLAFGEHLKQFLAERSVELNAYATLDELRRALSAAG